MKGRQFLSENLNLFVVTLRYTWTTFLGHTHTVEAQKLADAGTWTNACKSRGKQSQYLMLWIENSTSLLSKNFPCLLRLFEERCTWNHPLMVLEKHQVKVHRLLKSLHTSVTKYTANQLWESVVNFHYIPQIQRFNFEIWSKVTPS